MNHWIELEAEYGARIYHPLPVVLAKGKGVWVWDVLGKKYLDLLSAYSAVNFGHTHPRLVRALCTQARRIAIVSRAFYNDQLGLLLQKLVELSGLEKAIPMNTGAEAVETAIKAARLWGYHVKKIPEESAEIIAAEGNFHGRTTTVLSFSSTSEYRRGFGPFTPGFQIIPFGDAIALEKAITPHTCAFLVEPIQGEAGIRIPPPGWLKKVSEICKKHRILLILDEVQTGLGRTGKTFAFEHEGIVPDGLILGKALGGGLLPISAFLSTKEVLSLFRPGMHGSTFGGNSLACAVALETIQLLQDKKLAAKSAEFGAQWLSELKELKAPFLASCRGKGLWIGLEVAQDSKVSARKICERLMEKGILAKETHETVVRLAPPLIISQRQLRWATKTIQSVFNEINSNKLI